MSPELEQGEATAVLVLDCTVQYSITGSPGGEQRGEARPVIRLALSHHLTTDIITCQCPALIILSDC